MENNTVRRKEVSGSNATSKNNNEIALQKLTESDYWLSNVIRCLTVKNTIDDMKSVCSDLIAKVAKLLSAVISTNKKSTSEVATPRTDMNNLANHCDDEIKDIKSDTISNDEYVTKEEFEKVQDKVYGISLAVWQRDDTPRHKHGTSVDFM